MWRDVFSRGLAGDRNSPSSCRMNQALTERFRKTTMGKYHFSLLTFSLTFRPLFYLRAQAYPALDWQGRPPSTKSKAGSGRLETPHCKGMFAPLL